MQREHKQPGRHKEQRFERDFKKVSTREIMGKPPQERPDEASAQDRDTISQHSIRTDRAERTSNRTTNPSNASNPLSTPKTPLPVSSSRQKHTPPPLDLKGKRVEMYKRAQNRGERGTARTTTKKRHPMATSRKAVMKKAAPTNENMYFSEKASPSEANIFSKLDNAILETYSHRSQRSEAGTPSRQLAEQFSKQNGAFSTEVLGCQSERQIDDASLQEDSMLFCGDQSLNTSSFIVERPEDLTMIADHCAQNIDSSIIKQSLYTGIDREWEFRSTRNEYSSKGTQSQGSGNILPERGVTDFFTDYYNQNEEIEVPRGHRPTRSQVDVCSKDEELEKTDDSKIGPLLRRKSQYSTAQTMEQTQNSASKVSKDSHTSKTDTKEVFSSRVLKTQTHSRKVTETVISESNEVKQTSSYLTQPRESLTNISNRIASPRQPSEITSLPEYALFLFKKASKAKVIG